MEELRLADVLDKGGLIKASGLGGTIKQIFASQAETQRRAEDALLHDGPASTLLLVFCYVALARP